jgi:RHS repeat-associated protein
MGLNIPGGEVTGTTEVNGYEVPVDLVLSSRTGVEPNEYVASNTIEISGEFESGETDEFSAYIADETYAGTGNQYTGGGMYGMAGLYRYGFNGKENNNEVKGTGNQLDFGKRIYDSRIGKFFSTDPLTNNLSFYSPYLFAGNKPIVAVDQDGELEVIIHHKIYSKDGKTLIKEYTSKLIIETVEDIRGITRDPVNIEVVERMTTVSYQIGGSTLSYDVAKAQSAKIVNGGESYEDRMWAGWKGKVGKSVYKTLKKFWPPAKMNDSWSNANGLRDPVNNDLRDPSVRLFQSAEAIVEAVGIGRAPFVKDGLKKLAESQLKRVIDWGAEELVKSATNKLGIDKEKSAVLGYYVIKYATEGATGKISELFKAVEVMIKLGTKTTDAINEFSRIGISLEMPKNKIEAVNKALEIEGKQYIKINE